MDQEGSVEGLGEGVLSTSSKVCAHLSVREYLALPRAFPLTLLGT